MASTSFLISCSFLYLRPLRRKTGVPSMRIHAHKDGRRVDEGMVVLRYRIREIKLADKSYEPPAEWMWWEKQVYGDYDAFICHVIEMLQLRMMETRPAVVVGVSAILALSLPISAATLGLLIGKIAAVLLVGLHFP